jgi:hypothetical protein
MPLPYAGQEFTFHNPDGSQIRVRVFGHQFMAVFETLSGYTVVKDPGSGFFHYATVSQEGDELVPSGTPVGAADPRALGIASHARPARAATRATAAAAHGAPGLRRRWEIRRAQRRARLQAGRDTAARAENPKFPGPRSVLVRTTGGR